jgi:4-hydroxybenzoate polyprenyltransferase
MLKNWLIFTKERFDPISHLLMILVFVTVHLLFVNKLQSTSLNSLSISFLLIAVTFFYFKLRLYDEVKDYELDVVINPTRPLPRGLLKHIDMYKGIIFCIFLELFCFGFRGLNAVLAVSFAISYSLLMYKEFFIKDYIRPHLTTYAITHTIVTSFLSIAIFTFINQKTFIENINNIFFIFFALSNWMLFNIFEFGRKTFVNSEERPNIDTYSSLFGKKIAVTMVITQAFLSFYLTISIDTFHNMFIIISNAILILALTIVALIFINSENKKYAKLYRNMSSVYIILFYLILIIGLII